MVIQKTATRRKKSSKNKSKKTGSTSDSRDAEAIWNLTSDEIAEALAGPIDCEVVPFDATLDMEMDQQKDVWPENDTFGSSTADVMEELEILKEIFVADLAS
ncbi:unnamed protein product, partial [Nesidiocoris tenuis]